MRKLVFFGSDAIARPLLDWLRENGGGDFVLAGVVSQPDRPKGRGKKLSPNAISAWALEHDLPLHCPEKPGPGLEQWLGTEGIDLALVMAYGHLLKRSLLAVPPLGFVNFHASLLPAYRGASPVESAVACGEAETGVSLMRIVPQMDAGPVSDAERVAIDPRDTGASVREKLAAACVPLVARALPSLLNGSAVFHEQDEGAATYCRKLAKSDGALDFTVAAPALAARINGLFPWPGCYADHGEHRLKLKDATAEAGEGAPGEVLAADASGVLVACGQGVLRVREWQRPGAKMLTAGDFLRGYALAPGDCLIGGDMAPLTARTPFPRPVK